MNEIAGSAPKIYKTSDLYFSAFLVSIGFPLVTTEVTKTPDGSKKVIFLFNIPDTELPKLKAMYFGGGGTVKARTFVDNLRSLKSICFVILMFSCISVGLITCFM